MSDPSYDPYAGYAKWKAWTPETFASFTKRDHATFSCELRRAGVYITSKSQVLEVGFGNGSFAAWVRARRSGYVGTEANASLVDLARSVNIEAHYATLDLDVIAAGRRFDLIVMFDVLEHLPKNDILHILRAAARCLSTVGVIILRVPSGDSPFSGMYMHGDITHKTCLGSMAIHQIAGKSRLRVVQVRSDAFPILGFGAVPAIERLGVLLLRAIFSFLLRITYYGNKPAVLTPNLVAVLSANSDSA